MRRNEHNSPYSAAFTGCGFMLDETMARLFILQSLDAGRFTFAGGRDKERSQIVSGRDNLKRQNGISSWEVTTIG